MFGRVPRRLSASILATIALTLVACERPTDPSTIDPEPGLLAVHANVSATTIATMVVTVTGPGIPNALVFNLQINNGTATGTIVVPAGSNRTIEIDAFDETTVNELRSRARNALLTQAIVSEKKVEHDIEDLLKLCRADVTSKNDTKVKRFLANFDKVERKLQEVEEKDQVRNFQPPVSGDEIMAIFELKPSKIVGDLKEEIKEAIMEGHIQNNKSEALELMYKLAAKKGLSKKKTINK
jgi:hypothetical protein